MDSPKYIYFENKKFTRDDKTGYYLNSTIHKRMHVYVWEYFNGKVPKGFCVHHIDHNKANNDISNLKLIEMREHAILHGKLLTEEQRQNRRDNLTENARPKATEWHKSKAGREWHSEHAKQQAQNWEYRTYTCSYCGKEYQSRMVQTNIPNHFCSNNCKSAYRRKMGFDNVTKICEICGNEYVANKYRKTTRCENCRHSKKAITLQ